MRLAEYSVTVDGGRELATGYVALGHGQVYSITLRNHHGSRAEARLTVDGKVMSTFLLGARETLRVDGPPDDAGKGRFTFFKSDTPEADTVGAASVPAADKGLIEVVFSPEKRRPRGLTPDMTELLRAAQALKSRSVQVMSTGPSWVSGSPQYDGAPTHYVQPGGDRSIQTLCNVSEAFAAIDPDRAVGGLTSGVTGLTGRTDQEWVTAPALVVDHERAVTFRFRLVATDGPRPLVGAPREMPVPPPVG